VRTFLLCSALVLAAACGRQSPPPADSTAGDPLRSRQWGLDALDPEHTAWPTTRGEGVTVAVIDSGVDRDQPDLAGRVDAGVDLVDPGTPPDDGYGHGTHVAGIIAAEPGNGVGMAGLAPDVRILPVRVLDDDGDGSFERTARGIRWAVDHGAQVVNLSLTLSEDDPQVRHAVQYAVDHDVVVVAAAGNRPCSDSGVDETVYPAAYPQVIGVGAANKAGDVSGFSSCGPWVDVLAPGVSIVSIAPNDARKPECRDTTGWCYLTGTSEAAPFVSAAAALRIAQLGVSDYDAAQVAQDLGRTGRDGLDLAALLSP